MGTDTVQVAVVSRLSLGVILGVAAAMLALPATASAQGVLPPIGQTPQPSGYVSPNGTVVNLALNGLVGWESLSSTGDAFVDQFVAQDINPHTYTYTVNVVVHQYEVAYKTVATTVGNNTTVVNQVPYDTADQWANYSFAVPEKAWSQFAFTVPTAQDQRYLDIYVDGIQYHLLHHTLPSLLPFGTLSVGAVELIVAGVLLVAGLMLAVLIPIAKAIQTRGQRWAPKPKLGIWVPLVVLGGGVLALTFYAQLDFLLNTWVYIIIPVAFAIPMFFWLLRFFNSANVREILKADPQKGTHLRFIRWERMFAEEDGELILVWETWRGWLYSLLGHPIKVTRARTEANLVEGPPWAGQVLYEERKRKPKGDNEDFAIVGARPYEPGHIYFVDSDRAISVTKPQLSMHREVETAIEVPDGATDDGNGRAAVQPQTMKVRKLCWPYIQDGKATLHLAGIHWEHVISVALEWVRSEQLARALEVEALKNTVLRSEIETRAHSLAETLMDAFARMMARPNRPMTPEEAREEIQSWGRSFDPMLGGSHDRRKDRA